MCVTTGTLPGSDFHRVSLRFAETSLPGLLLVETARYDDDRGSFTETYSKRSWDEAGLGEVFVQDNLSVSKRGTLRGLHYQIEPWGMGKLVRAVHGSAFDVAVDLRRGSETFAQWEGLTLSADSGLSLWIPAGFAHGFIALEDETAVYYKSTALYTRDAERSLAYNDPAIGITWPMEPALISPKDAAAPALDEAEYNFTV